MSTGTGSGQLSEIRFRPLWAVGPWVGKHPVFEADPALSCFPLRIIPYPVLGYSLFCRSDPNYTSRYPQKGLGFETLNPKP